MKNLIIIFVVAGMLVSCSSRTQEQAYADNPLLTEFATPHEVPPFDKIETAHYLPAFKAAVKQQQQEIAALVDSSAAPTFANTLEVLDRSGLVLSEIDNIFAAMLSANTDAELQDIAQEVKPLLSGHQDDIAMNEKLYMRVKSVYERKAELDLTEEQNMLLEITYKDFVRGGANLTAAEKEQLRDINSQLSLLSLQFGQNVLKENNEFVMTIENEDDLDGLPAAVVSGAADAAAERGLDGKWVFTLHKPSLIPFLQYSDKRELREKIFKAYINRGNNDNELDNKDIVSQIVSLRVKKAQLLGYPTHADFMLENYMSKKPQRVYDFLHQIWQPALARAKNEVKDLQQLIGREGGDFKLEPWDWWYYAEKLKKEKYDLDDEALRPYFKLENVRDGAFALAQKLWGIQLIPADNIPVYHEDVKVFEVKEADGSFIGVLYVDYFPRESKEGGAWSSSFRNQSKRDGKNIYPVVYNVGNFSKPTGSRPALLSFDEALTLFHEFGHALHDLLSDCTYNRMAGTSVAWDFVELPSQIMENWASDPEVMKTYALHYETGEPIPDDLIDKIKNAGHFNQGFATVEYLSACFLDMDWHTLTEADKPDAAKFESEALRKLGLIPEIVVRYRSPYFGHIFDGGYSAGYYSYIWAEVLDSDAFQAFKETSLYDQATARSFRENILAKGGTVEPMTLYVRFRGKEPKIDALLKKRGLN